MSKEITAKHFIFPFIYFFSLSFAVIFISIYWIIKDPGGAPGSFAGSDSDDMQLNVAGEDSASNLSGEVCMYDDLTARKIDEYFGKNKAPLSGLGCTFTKEAETNNIDNKLVAAIAQCESGGGRYTPIYDGIQSFNAWGWAVYDSVESTKQVGAHNCNSWEDCIGRVSRGIVRESAERDLSVEPEDIVKWYSPSNGDESEDYWVHCVKSTMNSIGLTPLSQ